MKKSFLLLPIFSLVLNACTNADHTLATDVTSEGIPDWQNTGLQTLEMPSTMSQPYPPEQRLPTPMAQAAIPNTSPTPPAIHVAHHSMENVAQCQIVRDANHAPIYPQIQKGCYSQASYTVGKHDTLFLIAYLAGKNMAEIAALNQLTHPYQLRTGQILRLK